MALRQHQIGFAPQNNSATMISPLYQRRGIQETGHIELLPNPDFVFPARSSESSPTLENWNALNRRPRSAQQPTPLIPANVMHRSRGSASALPNFSFNPSVSGPGTASPSLATPPHSPNLPSPTTPSRGIGHRRGGSEFIGGDGMGGAGLLSTSPTKGDSILPEPKATTTRLGPPAGKGHRHRRSGAISCHDLQSILQPKDGNAQPRGGSAPATPLETEQKPFFTPGRRRSTVSQAEGRSSLETSLATQPDMDTSPPRVVPRVRVGFADRVEYIRPLSTISSETEGSMSTIRGHSVSGSMSSVLSAGAASPPSARMARPSLNTTFEDEDARPRPQSSGDILDSMTKDKEYFDVEWDANDANDRPKSAIASPSATSPSASSSSSKSPKRKSFTWWEGRRRQSDLRLSVSEPSLLPSPPSSPSSPENADFSDQLDESSSTGSEKSTRKPRKVKSWAHSLISRKSKSNSNLKGKPIQERVPTPPAFSSPAEPKLKSPAATTFNFAPAFEPNFDIDDTVTIVTEPQPPLATPQWNNRDSSDSDAMSPVIDLDAALGPFNTPPLGANTRASPIRSPPRARRSMHSLGFHASVYGTMSQSHRRTESAPELVPFDIRTTKAAAAATMPDVFEEEDEEEGELSDSPSVDQFEDTILAESPEEDEEDTMVVDVKKPTGEQQSRAASWTSESPLGIQTPDADMQVADPLIAIRPVDGHSSHNPLQSDPSSVEVVEDFEEPRASSLTRDSDSTITPPMTAEDEKSPRPLMNLSLPLPQQSVMTPDTLSGSSFSSQGFNNSQVSLSAPRLGTATSSGTDTRSFTFGEPGPAVRMSVDDVPSLSSSRSTMTTPPQNAFAGSGSYGPEGRSSSIYSIPSLDEQRRRSKRTSVASLSRLVGGPFGEKSKLSIESRPQSQHVVSTTPKAKKVNRLSKLIHFWKKPSECSRD